MSHNTVKVGIDVCTKVRPDQSALIIIDVQNDFCAKGGAYDKVGYDLSSVQGMIPALNKLIQLARSAKLRIIFIQSHYGTKATGYLSDVFLDKSLKSRERGLFETIPVCQPGSWGADFSCSPPLSSETIVHKHRYSAFYNTDLDTILRSNGVKTIIVTGATTDVCVQSTCRDGFFRDYYVVLVSDCSAAFSHQEHESSLKVIGSSFGVVTNSNELSSCWQMNPD